MVFIFGAVPSSQLTRRLCLPWTRQGKPAATNARKAKERTYPELLRSARCRLVVLGIELGGRWSTEAAQFIRLLARSRARAAPLLLRSSATAAYVTRWSALLSFAAARALAASLLSLPLAHTANVDGDPLKLSDLLGAAHEALPPSLPSRLPS